MILSDNIKKYRLEKNYTQEQLASILGISAQAVSKWETSETYPDGALLVPLANALDVSLDKLFGNSSVSLKEVSYDIRKLLYGDENRFDTLRNLYWEIEKSMFGTKSGIEEPFIRDEYKNISNSSFILDDNGFTHVSNGPSPFFMVVPVCEKTLSEIIGDGEEMRKIFAALSSPETMRAILFLYHNEPHYLFEKEILTEKCGISESQLDAVMQNLAELRLVYESNIEIDGKIKSLFYSRNSHLLIALLLVAHEMNYNGSYCYQAILRVKPFMQ